MTGSARTISIASFVLLLAATPLFAQSDWSAVRPNPVVTVEIRKVVGLMMLVPAVTLFLLYVFRPRPYVIAGVTAWVAASTMLLVFSFGSPVGDAPDRLAVGRTAVAIWAIAAVVFGAAIRLASLWFRAPAIIPRSFIWTFPIGLAWTVAAAAALRPVAVALPAFVMMSLWLALGASA